ncbi:MAG: peptidase MA family metallohydrolase, partial [Anaerolineales bacterium]
MTRFRSFVFVLLLFLLSSLVTPVHAQASIQVISDAASNTFPESIIFKAEFKSSVNITSVVLEYGVNQLTCGTVEAKAFPTLTPAADVNVDWTWEMRQSGSVAPGATVWWNWQVSDASGAQFTSPTKSILWLDSVHPWQIITGGNINLHYYNGGASFGQQLHDAAVQAMVRLSQDVGISTDSPVDIYIYANQSDLLEAVLYDPSWAGGQAFPENDIVIIGISPDQLDWGKSTEAHELTHVLVG